VRVFIHETLRRELTREPAHVCFTGHSLGGALATIGAVDFKIHSLPRIDAFIKSQQSPDFSRNSFSERRGHLSPSVRRIHVSMYNFGSPRVGNSAFAELFDKQVPDGFRVVVDGDPVPGVPFSSAGFKHVGTEVLIDSIGAGSITIDSSFIERRLRGRMKAQVSVHGLGSYRKGLKGVKDASKSMQELAAKHPGDLTNDRDVLRLALNVATMLNTPKGAESSVVDNDKHRSSPDDADGEKVEVEMDLGDEDERSTTILSSIGGFFFGRKDGKKVESMLIEDDTNAVQRRQYSIDSSRVSAASRQWSSQSGENGPNFEGRGTPQRKEQEIEYADENTTEF